MDQILDVEGAPLAPESIHMLEYVALRASELSSAAIRDRIRAAAQELENVVAPVSAADARLRPVDGKWTIAEVVDHISQTQIRGGEELRHLLKGRRPPLPPVYEALRSGAGQWAPWDLLKEELHAANQAMIELLQSAPEGRSCSRRTHRQNRNGDAARHPGRDHESADLFRRAPLEGVRHPAAPALAGSSHASQEAARGDREAAFLKKNLANPLRDGSYLDLGASPFMGSDSHAGSATGVPHRTGRPQGL
jgi:hypothetical protein